MQRQIADADKYFQRQKKFYKTALQMYTFCPVLNNKLYHTLIINNTSIIKNKAKYINIQQNTDFI